MNIEQEIIKLLKDNNITLEEIVERIKQDNRKISVKTISQQLSTGKIKYNDVQKILKILGYKIKFRKKHISFPCQRE
ncbi:unknown [Clostridium sp. CAG:768]|nr:unknown [Clostridium sp. CAG:768]